MRPALRRKYRSVRNEFKKDLYAVVKSNRTLGMLIIETYAAAQHRNHIHKIWTLSGKHPTFQKEYMDQLMGKHLTGENTIFRSLYFSNRDIYEKYNGKIPRDKALGDALSVAYKAMK